MVVLALTGGVLLLIGLVFYVLIVIDRPHSPDHAWEGVIRLGQRQGTFRHILSQGEILSVEGIRHGR